MRRGKTTAKRSRRKKANRNNMIRRHLVESLERRDLLTAAPVAVDDPWYDTAKDTDLVVVVLA